jgi:hypothetical protein
MIEQKKIKHINPRICSYEYTYPLNFMFYEYIISRSLNSNKNSLEKQMDEHISYFCNVILNNKII